MVRSILICVLTVTMSGYAAAQRADEIVSHYRKAVGPLLDESNSTTCYLEGEMCMQQLCFESKLFIMTPDNVRMEMKFQHLTFYVISNDSVSWEYNPLEKTNTIKKLGPKEERDNSGTMDFVNQDLLKYKEKKYSLRMLKEQKLDSLDVHVIEMTKADGEKVTYFINTRSYVIHKIQDKNGKRLFLNYAGNQGYIFPRRIIEQGKKQEIEMRFRLVRFNEVLKKEDFIIPDSAFVASPKENKQDHLLDKADRLNEQYPDSAIALYSQSMSEHGESERALNSRGLARIKRTDYYEAIGDFNKAIELNPKSATFYNNRGLAKYYLNDFENALKDYNRAVELDANLLIAHENRALALFHLKKYPEAINDFSFILKEKVNDGKNYFNRAVTLAQLEKYSEALEDYKRSELHGYREASLFNYRGVAEYQLEEYDSALISFQKAVKHNDKELQYLENLARTFYELERYEDAEKQFKKYIDASPENPGIINLLGLSNYFQENYKAAIKHFTKAIEKDSSKAEYFDNRAAAREELEDFTGAIADYDKSISLYPNDATIFYKRGLIKIHTSKKIEGCLDLATANEMKYKEAREAILKHCN